jgi:uncharacterized protein YgfB (UPF0149 family)
MSQKNSHLHLPEYQSFMTSMAVLDLDMSGSELHGMMCAYLCAGADSLGHSYIHALLHNKTDKASRDAALEMYTVFSVSQQHIANFDFEFAMLLPNEDDSLFDRAKAFSEWCRGFTRTLAVLGFGLDQVDEEEAQDILQHLLEFAELDYEFLDSDEGDEKALMEVSEYVRMAVIRLHTDLVRNKTEGSDPETTH